MNNKSNEASSQDDLRIGSRNRKKKLEHLLNDELEESFRFEALMAELSARFINLPVEKLDDAIEAAQRLICENLCLDRSALFQYSDDEPKNLLLTHFYQTPEIERPPIRKRAMAKESCNAFYVLEESVLPQSYTRVQVGSFCPWIYQQLRRHQTVVIPDIDEMPPEAALDQKRLRSFGTKSGIVVPLFAGGNWFGCLTFITLRDRKDWTLPEVKRFEFVGDVFLNALARKKAELALRESQERLTLATESAGAGLWSMEPATSRIWVTPQTRELFQFQPEEELNYQKFLALVHPEDRGLVRQATADALAGGETFRVDYRVILPDGRLRWISARGRCQGDGEATTGLLMGASVDITERKRAEERLRESEQRFRTLVEHAGDGFELVDESGRFLDVNAATLRQLGYTREEMLGMTIFEVDPLLNRDRFVENLESLRQGPIRAEAVHRRKDGTTFRYYRAEAGRGGLNQVVC
jgi:PAS domain S-box-containing protein